MYTLINLRGGGLCPEQYYGETNSMPPEDIYVKIRHSIITVDKNDKTILEYRVKDIDRGFFKDDELYIALKDSGCTNTEFEINNFLL